VRRETVPSASGLRARKEAVMASRFVLKQGREIPANWKALLKGKGFQIVCRGDARRRPEAITFDLQSKVAYVVSPATERAAENPSA